MLTELDLYPVYDSEDCDIVKELIVPLLSKSSVYLRGVGFFSSGWLRLASVGIINLVENGGRAQIISSPIISEKDLDAFIMGEEAKQSLILKEVLEKSISELAVEIEKNTFNALAWMIADGLLEFRFAIPREVDLSSDYHDKVGAFGDNYGNYVVIHGSLNDSLKGSLNGEAFSVFKSWEPGQSQYVEVHKKRLRQLWEGNNKQFYSFNIPESVKKSFVKLRSSIERPYRLPKTNTGVAINSPEGIRLPTKLREYQGKAIRSWIDSGCQGVLGMATGTGKTLTALSAAVITYLREKRTAVVVLVPYLHLLEQWADDCKKCGFNPVYCSSEHKNWSIKLKDKIQDFNFGSIDNICIVAVHATASSERFAKTLKKLKPEHSFVIGDEVHNLGGNKLRNAMLPIYKKRLGLSATPSRWFDDEGTDAIIDYFGSICFEYTLEDAINKYLTPYKYFPEKITLSYEEQEDYEDLTHKISKNYNNDKTSSSNEKSELLKQYLLKRARLISGAENKIPRMIEIFQELLKDAKSSGTEIRHVLVYCAAGTHREVLRRLSALGLRCHEFVHTVPLRERYELLGQFDAGKIQVLVAVKCLDEGVDVPATKIAFFLANTTNPKEFVQRRGRVLRKYDGKDEAILYDFFVVPLPEFISEKRDIDAGMLKREMPRFAEFSSCAKNQYESREIFWKLLSEYELLHLIDLKPWDVYRELKERNELLQVGEGTYV